jgi:hypothetical protein
MSVRNRLQIGWVLVAGILASCSSSPETGSAAPGSGANAFGNATGGSGVDSSSHSDAGTPAPRTASDPCDGKDNDGNGIIDDLDVDGDGVCDCLNIATIGEIGPWSDGGDVFKEWLSSRSPLGAVALGDQVLTDALLRPYQVIVVLYAASTQLKQQGHKLAAHHVFSDDEVAAFERWVRGGGGVMTTIGYTPDEAKEVENVNRLLAPLGSAYSTSKVDLDGYITDWASHPLTDGVKNIFVQNGTEPGGADESSLAWDSNHRVALQALQVDTGRAVVWGDEWITYDSQWQAVKDQQVARFWLNILKWLSPPKTCQVAIPVD